MANPVQANLTNAQASALSGLVNTDVGITRISATADDQGDPNMFAQFMTMNENTWGLMKTLVAGTVLAGAGLSCNAFAIDYRLVATNYTYPGGSITLALNDTHYLYLDSAQTLKSATGTWPSDNVYKLAIVTTDATVVTAIKDARHMNYNVGVNTSWFNVLPTSAIDFNGQDIKNFADLKPADPTELTIAAGVITPTQMYHTVASEGGAPFDDLVTITADPNKIGRSLYLKKAIGETWNLKSTGNVTVLQESVGATVIMTLDSMVIQLIQATATTWVTVAVPQPKIATLASDLDVNNKNLHTIRGLNLWPIEETISAGNVLVDNGHMLLNLLAESGAADDLDTVGPTSPSVLGATSDLLIVRRSQGNTITVKHSPGTANGFNLQGGVDFVMSSDADLLLCIFDNGAANSWQEIARFPRLASDLAGSDEAIYAPMTIHIPGTPTAGNDTRVLILDADCIIKSATMYAATAPSTGDAVVDIIVDGVSMFADQSEMPHVLNGANSDDSAIKNKAVTKGMTIRLEPELINAAADITVTLHIYMKPQVPPV